MTLLPRKPQIIRETFFTFFRAKRENFAKLEWVLLILTNKQ